MLRTFETFMIAYRISGLREALFTATRLICFICNPKTKDGSSYFSGDFDQETFAIISVCHCPQLCPITLCPCTIF